MSKIVLNCRPNGRRRLGKPWNRLTDKAEIDLSISNCEGWWWWWWWWWRNYLL